MKTSWGVPKVFIKSLEEMVETDRITKGDRFAVLSGTPFYEERSVHYALLIGEALSSVEIGSVVREKRIQLAAPSYLITFRGPISGEHVYIKERPDFKAVEGYFEIVKGQPRRVRTFDDLPLFSAMVGKSDFYVLPESAYAGILEKLKAEAGGLPKLERIKWLVKP